ncbi:hypothetical protein [Metamycoplasma equirhinis]|uniref:hypothetical protein n=1 Tax=Metamycoplasma equirhinis TaxID=92402 RepID=UPI0035931738
MEIFKEIKPILDSFMYSILGMGALIALIVASISTGYKASELKGFETPNKARQIWKSTMGGWIALIISLLMIAAYGSIVEIVIKYITQKPQNIGAIGQAFINLVTYSFIKPKLII